MPHSYLISADWHLKPATETVVFDALSEYLGMAKGLQVSDVVMLGDIYDVRYEVPINLQNRFLDWTHEVTKYARLHILPGNHDQDTVGGRHALEVFARHEGVTVHTEPGWDEHGLWLPYRKDAAQLESIARAPKPEAHFPNVGWLHHGIVGALMNDHKVAGEADGLHTEAFAAFDVVFCGHWHRHQEIAGKCVYTGSPWQTRKDEAGQEKGFIWMDEEGWEFLPVVVGRRHHRVHVGAGAPIGELDVRPGDIVHVALDDQSDAQRVVAELSAVDDVDIRVAPPKQVYAKDRLGVGEEAAVHEAALQWLLQRAEGDPNLNLAMAKQHLAEVLS